ncbi:MAG: 50S rRNA methyltransferase [Epsilonproteobacteria bacterium]|nr:MAG: 50S rRNA methyltransferase [Campylobacterota bacterium]RLA66811.1 MAG: 50S rRNA methyltransferase [Campylobacterota bacterium]
MGFKVKDHYFKKAKKEQFLARSVYKLEEIDKKFKVLKKSDIVFDLGYYPGSWIQYTAEKVKKVIGIDIKEVNKKIINISNVDLFKKDAFDIEDISELGVDQKFDVILSDMAPDTTGIKSVDQDRSLALVEKVFKILPTFLNKDGNFVIKVFDGNDAQIFLKNNKKLFKSFNYFRPKSTRSVSKEFFVIGKGYQG